MASRVDLDVLKTLDQSAVSYQVVLTKADQVKPTELEQRVAATVAALTKHPRLSGSLVTSSRTGAGMPNCAPPWCVYWGSAADGLSPFPHSGHSGGVMGADGIILAAGYPRISRRDGRWRGFIDAAVSRHAVLRWCATERGVIDSGSDRGRVGLSSRSLFAGDLTLRQYAGHSLFRWRADWRHASDRELAHAPAAALGRGGCEAVTCSPDGAKRNPGPTPAMCFPGFRFAPSGLRKRRALCAGLLSAGGRFYLIGGTAQSCAVVS